MPLVWSQVYQTGVPSIEKTGSFVKFRLSGTKNRYTVFKYEDLKRQEIVLESYCATKGYDFELISDMGSGLNYKKKGLVKLIKLLCSNQVDRLVITHKDRLCELRVENTFFAADTTLKGSNLNSSE